MTSGGVNETVTQQDINTHRYASSIVSDVHFIRKKYCIDDHRLIETNLSLHLPRQTICHRSIGHRVDILF